MNVMYTQTQIHAHTTHTRLLLGGGMGKDGVERARLLRGSGLARWDVQLWDAGFSESMARARVHQGKHGSTRVACYE